MYTDGKVTTPINVADLSQLLNRSQEDINKVEYSNLLTSVGGLCTHPNINKWAKYKPIKHHVIGNITEDNRIDRKGNGELYGVIITGGIVLAKLHDVAFTYVRPEGGEKSPYRLGDFLGYDHKAKPSVSGEMQWGGKGSGFDTLTDLTLTNKLTAKSASITEVLTSGGINVTGAKEGHINLAGGNIEDCYQITGDEIYANNFFCLRSNKISHISASGNETSGYVVKITIDGKTYAIDATMLT